MMLNNTQYCIYELKITNVKQCRIVYNTSTLYPQRWYNLNRLFAIFFVNLKKKKASPLVYVAKKRRNKSLIYPHGRP